MASTYLSKTFGTGNRRTFTISTWLKISDVSSTSQNEIFSRRIDSNNQFRFSIFQNKLYFIDQQSNVNNINFLSNALRRDCNGFYHVVLKIDTTQATEANRVKLYVNGTEETSFSTSTYPSQNYETYINQNAEHRIGEWNSTYFNGLMTHFHFIDGTAYDPSTFGETDSTTGIWKPKTAPSVTYGTNGFFLKFENSGSMGTDSSGNANNFTVNGTLTQTKDTPSNVFAVLNPLNNNNTLSQGNLKAVTATNTNTAGTLGFSSGKWYYEVKVDTAGGSYPFVGFGLSSANYIGVTTSFVAGTSAWVGSGGLSNGDIVGLAIDTDLNTFKGYINGVEVSSSSPYISGGTITSGQEWIPVIGGVSSTLSCNFGNGYFGTTAVASANADDNGIGAFEYAPPTGHLAICTKNINAQEYS